MNEISCRLLYAERNIRYKKFSFQWFVSIRIIDKKKTLNDSIMRLVPAFDSSIIELECFWIEHGNKNSFKLLEMALFANLGITMLKLKHISFEYIENRLRNCNARSRPIFMHWRLNAMEKYFHCYGLMSITKLLLCYPIHFSRKKRQRVVSSPQVIRISIVSINSYSTPYQTVSFFFHLFLCWALC